jgi:GNAT superfamily N-acetyltransferase
MMEKQMLAIRNATAADAPLLATIIREFAEFERELDLVTITSEDLIRDGFQSDPRFHAVIAEWSGQTAGYALYFFNYSTWAGRRILFLEDLFVRAEFRGKGIGKALLKHMAVIAHEKNCCAMRWEVVDWNTSAIELYHSLGAKLVSERLQFFLTGDSFRDFAGKGDQR